MERLRDCVGREKPLREVSQTIQFDTRSLGPAVTGAVQVTCADETERECVEAFQQGFVTYALPSLKSARKAPFRMANIGARYEWGGVHIAAEHFASAPPPDGAMLLVVKINGHVGCEEVPPGTPDSFGGFDDMRPLRLGSRSRYGTEAPACGALGALLAGKGGPFATDLGDAFRSEGVDRVALLNDPARVAPAVRALYAAIVSARLQARSAVLDLQDRALPRPTFSLVLPCVTLNREGSDTEILCGIYTVDGRGPVRNVEYYGLGDDPAAYEITARNRRLVVSDDQVGTQRRGRNHRALIEEQWRKHVTQHGPLELKDERMDRLRADVARNQHRNHHHARRLLRAALPILAEVAPVPAAILMFADGAVGIHHAHRIHRLAREMEGTAEARRILAEMHDRIDQLDPERAEALIEMLMREYRP
ncbi:MAG: hypothetical protein GY716_12650 [bacterium]|nr:hypothetical protein [bacterium]